MPDGLYKTLPLTREWQRLLKHCEREADRGAQTHSDAEAAVAAEATRELSDRFLRGLRRMASESEAMLPGLDTFSGAQGARDLGGEGSELEESVVRRLLRLRVGGLRGGDLVTQSIADTLSSLKDRRVRQVEQHYLVTGDWGDRRAIEAAREASASVDVRMIAERLFRGQRTEKAAASKPLDLSENLLGPR